MFARIKSKLAKLFIGFFCMIAPIALANHPVIEPVSPPSLAIDAIAKHLGWVESNENSCGGYYLETPIPHLPHLKKKNAIAITSNEGLYAQYGTSILEEKVTVTRAGQQITGNRAFLYRDPNTGKLMTIDIVGNVHLREQNTLIIGTKGHYDFRTKAKSFMDLYYRTTLSHSPAEVSNDASFRWHDKSLKNGDDRSTIQGHDRSAMYGHDRKITALTAWGQANAVSSEEPHVYELSHASFSTCTPTNPMWQIKANHIKLDKNKGRGYAKNATLLIKNIPVFYIPYLSFSVDQQRKSGFLWPSIGIRNEWGPYVLAPFYWNMAPNFDMTLTPGFLSKRGFQLSENFRYLSETSSGRIDFSILPNDRLFSNFQRAVADNPVNANPPLNQANSVTEAEINRLLNSSPTRKGFFWRDDSRFNDNWSSHVDFNYASDDYYLRNFGSNLNEITQNQLLQEADIYYKNPHWNFTGRLQSYQTLHPVDENFVSNQYRRLPQLILSSDYPDQYLGLEYFMTSEATHFDILNNPGSNTTLPTGDRLHFQPGVSLPIYRSNFFLNPRIQLAMTQYNFKQIDDTDTPPSKSRVLPIVDVASGLFFSREISFFKHIFHQTLEPQIYYTYIPYRNQSSIPIFDTTVNTLTYDQIFNYNRFSGLDRIGDTNQIGIGVTTRFIDQYTGFERIRFGIGEIIYFTNRRVTLCNNSDCTDNPSNPSNHWRVSPLSMLLNYNFNPIWSISANAIWNPTTKQMNNATITFHLRPDEKHILNVGYSYAHNGDILSGLVIDNAQNNIKSTDISFAWPVNHALSIVGRWSQDWSANHFQNLLYGLQYDTCCWAVRLVGGRAFTNLTNNTPQYSSQFYIQFALKGLGNIGTGNPNNLLSSISGYKSQFGQEI